MCSYAALTKPCVVCKSNMKLCRMFAFQEDQFRYDCIKFNLNKLSILKDSFLAQDENSHSMPENKVALYMIQPYEFEFECLISHLHHMFSYTTLCLNSPVEHTHAHTTNKHMCAKDRNFCLKKSRYIYVKINSLNSRTIYNIHNSHENKS